MTITEVLNSAADKIERDGWWGGFIGEEVRGSNPTCAGLALSDCSRVTEYDRDTEVWWKTTKFFVQFIDPDFDDRSEVATSAIYAWNDRQPDGETVVATLRAAAKAAEKLNVPEPVNA